MDKNVAESAEQYSTGPGDDAHAKTVTSGEGVESTPRRRSIVTGAPHSSKTNHASSCPRYGKQEYDSSGQPCNCSRSSNERCSHSWPRDPATCPYCEVERLRQLVQKFVSVWGGGPGNMDRVVEIARNGGWLDQRPVAETNGEREAALQDLSYRNGAQQALVIAHQSLQAADQWLAKLWERSGEARAALKAEVRRDCYGTELGPIAESDGALYAAVSAQKTNELHPKGGTTSYESEDGLAVSGTEWPNSPAMKSAPAVGAPPPGAADDVSAEHAGRALYHQHIDLGGIHCNRYPAWSELSEADRAEWIKRAAAAEPTP